MRQGDRRGRRPASRPTSSTRRRSPPTASSGTCSATGRSNSPSPCCRARIRPAKDETRATIAFIFDEICKLLHPFMPFLTEELWAIKGAEGPSARRSWRCAVAAISTHLIDAEAEAEIGWVVDLVTEIRSARSETNVPAGAQIPLVLVAPPRTCGPAPERWGDIVKRLARISEISFADAAPKSSVQLIVRGEVGGPAAGGRRSTSHAERARLAKEIQKLDAEIGQDRREARQRGLPRARAGRGGRRAARAPRGGRGPQGEDGRGAARG